jgi:hypothetical protein
MSIRRSAEHAGAAINGHDLPGNKVDLSGNQVANGIGNIASTAYRNCPASLAGCATASDSLGACATVRGFTPRCTRLLHAAPQLPYPRWLTWLTERSERRCTTGECLWPSYRCMSYRHTRAARLLGGAPQPVLPSPATGWVAVVEADLLQARYNRSETL